MQLQRLNEASRREAGSRRSLDGGASSRRISDKALQKRRKSSRDMAASRKAVMESGDDLLQHKADGNGDVHSIKVAPLDGPGAPSSHATTMLRSPSICCHCCDWEVMATAAHGKSRSQTDGATALSLQSMDLHRRSCPDAWCGAEPVVEEMPGGSFREPKVDSGMTLPFQPMTLTFTDMHYYVKCPPVRSRLVSEAACILQAACMERAEGFHDNACSSSLIVMVSAKALRACDTGADVLAHQQTSILLVCVQEMSGKSLPQVGQKNGKEMLELLQGISGAFRPAILTCLMVSRLLCTVLLWLRLSGHAHNCVDTARSEVLADSVKGWVSMVMWCRACLELARPPSWTCWLGARQVKLIQMYSHAASMCVMVNGHILLATMQQFSCSHPCHASAMMCMQAGTGCLSAEPEQQHGACRRPDRGRHPAQRAPQGAEVLCSCIWLRGAV